jgi:tetratricopeptide (TPR) repeat protein
MPAADRPFKAVVDAQLAVGRVDAAKTTVADYVKAVNGVGAVVDTNTLTHMEGSIALAEKKFDVAAAKFRARTVDLDFGCLQVCELPLLAQAYDQGGKADSAIAVYERYLSDKQRGRVFVDGNNFGPSLKRLGELYEAKGDRENAAKRYAEFVDLWKGADPELQPAVKDVQSRLARLRISEPVKSVTPKR